MSTTTNNQPTLDVRLLKALSHTLRQRILVAMRDRVASPSEISTELEEPLANVSYHFKILLENNALELVRTRPVRGAVEHFYRASPTHVTWTPLELDSAAFEELSKHLTETVELGLRLQVESAARLSKLDSADGVPTRTELAMVHFIRTSSRT